MISKILVLVLVLNCAFSQQQFPTILTQVSQENQFGSAISNLIQMQMQNMEINESVQEIADLLYDIRGVIEGQNESEAERIANVRSQCDSDISSLNDKIREANSRLTDSEQEQRDLQDEEQEKKANLREETANYEQMQQDLEQAEQDLEEENQSFEVKQRDYNTLIDACEAGIALLQHMVHGEVEFGSRQGAAFIQLTQIKNKFATVLTQFETHSNTAMMQPVLNALANLSTKSKINYDEFMQCLNLLDDIRKRLNQDLNNLTQRHNQLVNDLNTLMVNLNESILISGNIIDIYNNRLRDISTRLDELSDIISETSAYLNVLNTDLTNTTNFCDTENELYETAQAKRDQELSMIGRLIEHFETQVQPATDNIRDGASLN